MFDCASACLSVKYEDQTIALLNGESRQQHVAGLQ